MKAIKTLLLLLVLPLALASCSKNMGTLKIYFSGDGDKTIYIYPEGSSTYILKEVVRGDEFSTDLNIGNYTYNGVGFQIREGKTTIISFGDSQNPLVKYD